MPPARTFRTEVETRLAGAPMAIHTFVPATPIETAADLDGFYGEVAAVLARRGQTLLHEKAFGVLDLAAAADDARDRALATDAGRPVPHSFIEGRPCAGGRFAGVQAWAMPVSPGVAVTPVRDGPRVVGMRVDAPAGRALFLHAANGLSGDGSPRPTVGVECRAAFDRAATLLAREGFSFGDVARTWLFVAHLLDWYDELNRVRTRFYRECGLMAHGPESFLPASTGIQGRDPSGAEIVIDVLAVAGGTPTDPALRPLRSPRQDAAFSYGSAFSRGMRVGPGDAPVLLVSGTAAIDRDGRSCFPGDPSAQIADTYLNVAAVLQPEGAGLADIASAIRYYKDTACWETHREMAARGLLPDLPAIDVLADVCRDELLFEMEAMAAGT